MDRKSKDRRKADRLPDIVLICSRDQVSDNSSKLRQDLDELRKELEKTKTEALKDEVKQHILTLLRFVESAFPSETWIQGFKERLGGGGGDEYREQIEKLIENLNAAKDTNAIKNVDQTFKALAQQVLNDNETGGSNILRHELEQAADATVAPAKPASSLPAPASGATGATSPPTRTLTATGPTAAADKAAADKAAADKAAADKAAVDKAAADKAAANQAAADQAAGTAAIPANPPAAADAGIPVTTSAVDAVLPLTLGVGILTDAAKNTELLESLNKLKIDAAPLNLQTIVNNAIKLLAPGNKFVAEKIWNTFIEAVQNYINDNNKENCKLVQNETTNLIAAYK